jgi:cell division protein FtsI (penicillin-binding protein 3)
VNRSVRTGGSRSWRVDGRPRRSLQREGLFCQGVSNRTRHLCAAVGIVYLGLMGRLVWIQGLAADRFAGGTAVSAMKERRVETERGRIFDRDMNVLVRNEPGFTVVVDPNSWFDDNRLAEDTPSHRRARAVSGLSVLLPGSGVETKVPTIEQLEARRRSVRAAGGRRVRTLDLVRWVSEADAERIRSANLNGVGLHPTVRRQAVQGTHASALLGTVSRYGQGLQGLEHRWQSTLAGTPGRIRCRADLRGMVPGTETVVAKGIPGKDIVLTLDSDLQHEVERELALAVTGRHAEAGTAVVLDVRTGDILAAASAPTFDINQPGAAAGESTANLVSQMVYEPGSTFKTFTIAGALEAGLATPADRFACDGDWEVGKRKVRCKPHGQFRNGHGSQSLGGVLTHSCNVASALLADRMGGGRMEQTLQSFGFGRSTRSGMPGEESGLVPREWSRIRTANVGFGQGIAVTPIQLVAAYGALADGRYRAPRIVKAIHDPTSGRTTALPMAEPTPVISGQTATAIRSMLESVVKNGTGTLAALPQYRLGGKTGTAQIAEGRGYGNRYFASFVGLAPITEPRFAILVAIKAPRGEHYGGSVAGPVFRAIAERALTRYRVEPDQDRPLGNLRFEVASR